MPAELCRRLPLLPSLPPLDAVDTPPIPPPCAGAMSLLRRRTVLRRFFAALERIASNVGLIREAGKEFRLFSAEVGAWGEAC